MDKQRKKTNKIIIERDMFLCFVLSFAIPVILMALIYLTRGIYPSSKLTCLQCDMKDQQMPFLAHLKNLGNGYNTLGYQNRWYLGGPFWASFSYYCMSPLNLLAVLFPMDRLPDAMYFLIVTKIGLCGLSFSVFHWFGPFKKNIIFNILFSCSYALMGWNTACVFYNFWYDSVYMLPLIALGAELVFKGKKGLLFTVSVALSLIFNYYIAFFNVVFIVLYCIFRTVYKWEGLKKAFYLFRTFFVCGLLATGGSAFVILPVALDLLNGKGSDDSYHAITYSVASVKDTLSMLLPIRFSGLSPDSAPYIYVGMFPLALVVLFFFSDKIHIRGKIAAAIVMLFYLLSFCTFKLNFLWHGLTSPVGVPSRFSYTFSFFLLAVASFSASEPGTKLSAYLSTFYNSRKKGIIIFGSLYIFLELFLTGSYSASHLSTAFSYLVYGTYGRMLEARDLFSVDTYDGFRTFSNERITGNDESLFDQSGIGGYSSSYSLTLSRLFESMGLGTRNINNNVVAEQNVTPVVRMFFSGKRYIYCGEKLVDNLTEVSSLSSGIYKMTVTDHALPVMYCVEPLNEIDEPALEDSCFAIQNRLAEDLSGISAPFCISGYDTDYEGGADNSRLIVSYDVPCDSYVWIYYPFAKSDESHEYSSVLYKYNCQVNGEHDYEFNTGRISASFCIGHYFEGDHIDIEFTDTYGLDQFPDIAALRDGWEEEAYSRMSSASFTDYRETIEGITGWFESDNPKDIFITFPFYKGMEYYLDGELQDIELYMDVFPIVHMPAGKHELFIQYKIFGMKQGALLTFFSLILSFVYFKLCITNANQIMDFEKNEK